MTFIHISLQVARDKTEELSEVIARLRAYERGHYGLEEAVDEVSTVKKHLKIKDRQIEELTQEANSLQVNIYDISVPKCLFELSDLF
jgi:hypothetical protein